MASQQGFGVRVRVEVAQGSGEENKFSKQLQTMVDRIPDSKLPKIAVQLDKSRTHQIFQKQLKEIMKGLSLDTGQLFKDSSNGKAQTNQNDITKQLKEQENAAKAAEKAIKRLDSIKLQAGNKLITLGNFESSLKDAKKYRDRLDEISNSFKNAVDSNGIRKASNDLRELQAEAKKAGDVGSTMGEKFKGAIAKFAGWYSVSRIVMNAVQAMRSMVANVRELDTAMTDLRKVTDETDATYQRFLKNAGDRAVALGATMSDVVRSVADFSKLGYDLESATALAESALIYKNVGDLGIEDATQSIISTMKAFNIEVDKSLGIVDRFNEVGNRFAITSSGIGVALQKSAAALMAAGNDIDQSIALITASNAVIQNPDQVGTALKTVSMRLRSTKVELEQFGEEADGAAETTSELQAKLKALSGVDIMLNADTFKSTYDILMEISKVWDTINNKDQAAVLELMAGTRQGNIVSSLIGNMSEAQKVLEASLQSSGSAMKENEIYLDSIDGKLDQFTAKFQILSENIIDSNLIKDIVDFGSKLLGVTNNAAELTKSLGAIPTLLTAITAAMSIKSNTGIFSVITDEAGKARISTEKFRDSWKSIFNKDYKVGKLTSNLSSALDNDTNSLNSYLKQIESGIDSNVAFENSMLNASSAAQKLAKSGDLTADSIASYTTKQQTANSATIAHAASTTKLTVAQKALSVAMNVGVMLAVSLAIQGVVSGIQYLIEYTDKLIKKGQEAQDLVVSLSNSFNDTKKTINGLKERYAELAQSVDKFNNNKSLSNDEYEEFLSLQNQIAEMFPEIVSGYDSEGNAILKLDGDVKSIISSLDELIRVQRELANFEIVKAMPDAFVGMQEEIKQLEKEIDNLETKKDTLGTSVEAILSPKSYQSNTKEKFKFDSWLDKSAFSEDAKSFFDKIQKVISDEYARLVLSGENPPSSILDYKTLSDNDKATITHYFQDYERQYKISVAGLDKEIALVNQQINAKYRGMNPFVNAWLEADSKYNEMSNTMQEIARTMVSNLDFKNLGINTSEGMEEYVNKNILNPLYNAEPEVQDAFAKIIDFKDILSQGEITFDEFATHVKDAFNSLGKDTEFSEVFVQTMNAAGFAGENFEEVLNSLIKTWGLIPSTVQSVTFSLEKLNNTIDSIQSAFKTLQSAQEEYNKTGILSVDTLQELLTLEPEYLNALIDENGQINLNSEAVAVLIGEKSAYLKTLAAEQVASYIASLAQEKLKEKTTEASNAVSDSVEDTESATNALTKYAASALTGAVSTQALKDALSGNFEGLSDEDINEITEKSTSYINQISALINSAGNSIDTWTGRSSSAADKIADKIPEAFTKAYNDIKFQYDTFEIDTETFYNGLETITNKYLTKGSEHWRKYYLEIQNGRKQLAREFQSAYDNIQYMRDAGIINEQKYLDELYALNEKYNKANLENWRKYDLEIQNGRQALLEKSLKQQGDAYIKAISNQIKQLNDDIKASNDYYDRRIERLNEQLEESNDLYDKKIDKLKEQKDSITSAANEETRLLNIEKARIALAKAQSQKTRQVFRAGEGFVWEIDQTAVADAQENLNNLMKEYANLKATEAIDKQIKALEDAKKASQESIKSQIKNLEDLKKSSAESIQSQIDDLEGLKNNFQEKMDLIGVTLEDYQTNLELIAEATRLSFDKMSSAAEDYASRVKSAMSKANSAQSSRGSGGGGSSSGGTDWNAWADSQLSKGVYFGPDADVRQIKKRASGDKRIGKAGIYNIDEEGAEAILSAPASGKYQWLHENDMVFKASATKNLWDFANNPVNFISKQLGSITGIGSGLHLAIPQGGGINVKKFVFGDLSLPNVKDANSFVNELKGLSQDAIQRAFKK